MTNAQWTRRARELVSTKNHTSPAGGRPAVGCTRREHAASQRVRSELPRTGSLTRILVFSLLAGLPATVGCAADSDQGSGEAPTEPAAESSLSPVAVVELDNANEYHFLGVSDEQGAISEIAVMETGPAGNPSLENIGAATLNPLELYLGLTGEDQQPPGALLELYRSSGNQERGWIADALLRVPVEKALNGCSNAEFLARFGNLQAGYDYHSGPDQGAWLDRSWSNFVWQKWAKKVHLGTCVQSCNDYTRVAYKYRQSSADPWTVHYNNHYVPQGWYLHWFWNSSVSRIHRLEIDPNGVTCVYDIGFDYSK